MRRTGLCSKLALLLGLAGVLGSAGATGADGAPGAAPAGTWDNLWSTREQQAQRLLDEKKPAEAAPLFGDARRRAYAELQAGQFDKAAEHLAPFRDADSEYNRGNALAHTGKLQDALAAYDAALAQSPKNDDVLRNRELVARALKDQNRSDQKSGDGKSQNGGKGDDQGQSNSGKGDQGANGAGGQKQDGSNSNSQSQSGGQQQAGNQGQQGSQSQSGNRSQAGNPAQAKNQAQQGNQGQAAGQAQAANQTPPGSQGQPGNQPQPGPQGQSGSQSQAGNQTQPGNGSQPNSKSAPAGNKPQDDLSEAARLAQRAKSTDPTSAQAQAQALADAGQGSGANSRDPARDTGITANKARVAANADPLPQPPRSEQALALDQWLRGIPEDSGELLRRKFMIEHMMKEQGYQP